MDTHSLDYVVGQLGKTKGTWRVVSKASGVPYDTLTKVALRRVKNPRVATVEALAKYFSRQGRRVNPPA